MHTAGIAKILELAMVVCFGAAWPASILKSLKSRTAKGKSIFFLVVVLVGYLSGLAKTILLEGVGGLLMFAYALNFIMVSIDTALYFRNSRFDKIAERRVSAPLPTKWV
ncbi:MAG: hypothetical protein LBS45_02295 [Synergistaceae bacterium]|jgi:hypothetical protein|nr:hypothetical protein [Synergistaceae bacterium]